MRDQKKADEIAEQRVQILSPLLAEGLDSAQARQIKARICEQTGISERTLRRYLAQYRKDGFSGLKPKGKGERRSYSNPGMGRIGRARTNQAQYPTGETGRTRLQRPAHAYVCRYRYSCPALPKEIP